MAPVTFERDSDNQDILPDWAWGASGWMFSSGANEDEAYEVLRRDIEFHGLRLLAAEQFVEICDLADVDEIDDQLAVNIRTFGEGHRTAWGTIHGYKGEGEV